MLPNNIRQLKTIHSWHAYVRQDDGHIILQQQFECFSAGIGLDQVFSQVTQHHLIAEQLARLIINHEDIDLVLGTHVSSILFQPRPSLRANGVILSRHEPNLYSSWPYILCPRSRQVSPLAVCFVSYKLRACSRVFPVGISFEWACWMAGSANYAPKQHTE